MSTELAEAAVVDAIADYLDSERFALALKSAAEVDEDTTDVVRAIGADRERLSALRDKYADGDFTQAEYREQKARIEARIAANEAALSARRERGGLGSFVGMTGEAFRTAWGHAAPHERRGFVVELTGSLTIKPWVKGCGRRQAERVVWVPKW